MRATTARLVDTGSDHRAVIVDYDVPAPLPRAEPVKEPVTVTAYLVANPPRIRQYRERGTTPSGVIVVHTAESTPDWVGADSGAEAVARFIRDRTTYGSYHDLCDSDSIVNLVPYDHQAYGDGTGSNPHAYHVSAATQAAKWNQAPKEWRDATVRNMAQAAARYARWIEAEHGVTIPARRVTKAQSTARVPGFISHGERDPGRRSDPGAGFPWTDFLNHYSAAIGEGDDDMALDDKLWPNDDVTVRDVLRSLHKFRLRSDARLKELVGRDGDELADAIAERLSTEVPAAKVKAAVKEALREGVDS